MKKMDLPALEQKIESTLEKVTEHRYFLQSVSSLINLNSKRILLSRRAMVFLLDKLQLPHKEAHVKQAFMLQEMQFHIHRLETELSRLKQPKRKRRLQSAQC